MSERDLSMSDDIIQAINECPMVKNIPSGISLLLEELTREDTDIDKLIVLLEKFPVVCVRIIMVANSAWAAPKTEITNLKRACMQLGLTMIKSISIALLVSQQFNSQNCKGFNEKTFWLSSLVLADLMRALQQHTQKPDTEASTAHLIGLIHNMGILVIAEVAAEKMSQAILLSNNSDVGFSQALTNNIGISYLDATHLILKNWGLPYALSHSFGSKDETPYTSLVQEAMALKNTVDLNANPFAFIDEIEESSPILTPILDNQGVYNELCGLYCR